MAGLGADEARHHAIDGGEHLMRMLDFTGGVCEPRVLLHGEPAADQQHRDGHQECPSPPA